MAIVFQLKESSEKAAADLARLGSELHGDSRSLSKQNLDELISKKDLAIVVVRDSDQIVGMGSLYVIQKIGKLNAYIEDVIVDSGYRGQGLGERVVRQLLTIAKEKGVRGVTLTSRSHRIAAHKLYEKLGFKTVDTNVFKLSL